VLRKYTSACYKIPPTNGVLGAIWSGCHFRPPTFEQWWSQEFFGAWAK